MDLLRSFDGFSKTLEDFRVRTVSGALISITGLVIVAILTVSEFMDYTSVRMDPFLDISTMASLDSTFPIQFDIVLPNMPCFMTTLDVMDVAGDHQNNIAHAVYKVRRSKEGKDIETYVSGVRDVKLPFSGNKSECGGCYGAESERFRCCNTCDDVRLAYEAKQWSFNDMASIEQCVREGWADKLKNQAEEGCRIYGTMQVKRVAGSFHIAPGPSFELNGLHVHDIGAFHNVKFDMSHEINRLQFGFDNEKLNRAKPLDGTKRSTQMSSHVYTYFIKVVHTRLIDLSLSFFDTHQYSVTQHEKDNDPRGQGVAGIFFHYDISPLMIVYKESHRSWAQFLTGLCAIVGGVLSVMGLLDATVWQASQRLRRKIALGKAN